MDWVQRVVIPVQPPMSTIEQFPDPVSQRLTFRRYHSEPAGWQVSTQLVHHPGVTLHYNFRHMAQSGITYKPELEHFQKDHWP